MYPYILRVMNHMQYDRVFLRDPRTAKKMFFYADLSEFDVVRPSFLDTINEDFILQVILF